MPRSIPWGLAVLERFAGRTHIDLGMAVERPGDPVRKLFALGLGAVVALAADGTGVAQDDPSSVRVEVRVWQHVENGQNIHVSARPEGGLWRTLGTRRLRLDDGFDPTDTFRYGDIAVDVPLWNWASPVTVEVRVWQHVEDGPVADEPAQPVDDATWD